MRYGISGSGDYFTSHLKLNKFNNPNSSSSQWNAFGMQMLGSLFDIAMVAGVSCLAGTSGSSKKAVNANALATVSNNNQQIATLNQAFHKQYGIAVDTKTGQPEKPLATIKAETQAEINRLKKQAGMQDAKGADQTNADYEAYKTQMQTVDALNNAANSVQQYETALKNDEANGNVKQNGGTKNLIVKQGDTWSANTALNVNDYASLYPDNPKHSSEVQAARQRALEADQQKADQIATNHNNLVQSKKAAIDNAKSFNGTIAGRTINIGDAATSDQIKTAANGLKAAINSLSGNKPCGTAGTCASVDARLEQLNKKLVLYSDSASFDSQVKKIATLITERDEAQALIDAKKAMDDAKSDKKLAAKGHKKDAKARYNSASQNFYQLLAQQQGKKTIS